MTDPVSVPVESAGQRLLKAAAGLFAARGIEGASTREIARQAGVNEVTLFRKFGSKEGLVAAVVENMFGPQAKLIASQPIPETLDLRMYLVAYARSYSTLITSNLPLIRTMIGEIHRFENQEKQVFHSIFRPFRQRLVDRLEREDGAGGIASQLLADQLNAMIFMDALRRSSASYQLEYAAEVYLEGCVELLLAQFSKPGERPEQSR